MNIPLFKIYWDEEDIKRVSSVIQKGGYWAIGPEIKEFENLLAGYTERKYVVAVSSGTDLAMRAASLVLMRDDLFRILDAFDLSSKTLRIIKQNLFWAFLYNGIGVTLAVAGLLSPILAAAAMVASSLSVIGNSLRLQLGTVPERDQKTGI